MNRKIFRKIHKHNQRNDSTRNSKSNRNFEWSSTTNTTFICRIITAIMIFPWRTNAFLVSCGGHHYNPKRNLFKKLPFINSIITSRRCTGLEVSSRSNTCTSRSSTLWNQSLQFHQQNIHDSKYNTRLFSAIHKDNDNNEKYNNEMKDDDDDEMNIIHQQHHIFLKEIKSFVHHEIFTRMLSDGINTTNESVSSSSMITSSKPKINIIVAVSGGCDSIALFHTMLQIMNKRNNDNTTRFFESESDHNNNNIILECNIHVVHFDHQQRNNDSDGDRLFVQNLCEMNDVPFHCFYWDDYCNEMKKQERVIIFSQESARDWRRRKSIELLKHIIRSSPPPSSSAKISSSYSNFGIVLTAHHKDDAEETMIMKFLRGVHLTNWFGMDPLQRIAIDHDENNNNLHLYFGKPMLCIRKNSIQDFLLNQKLQWRDDESNQSDKYLRNRVRHHLMPLLQDLVGGEDILATRLKNIEKQSYKLRNDVSSRAIEYLGQSNTHFFLPIQHGEDSFGLVQEEALHMWIRKESGGDLSISYDKLSMISQQILNFPERRQWKLSLGGDWYVKRQGDILELESQIEGSPIEDDKNDNWVFNRYNNVENDLKCDVSVNGKENILLTFSIKERHDSDSMNFSLRKVEGNEEMKFLPPWRKNESRGVKIKEFLRGQKVPLHLRGSAPILCIQNSGEIQIGAVYVDINNGDKEGRWIVNGIYTSEDDELHNIEKVLLRRNKVKT